MRYQPLRVRGRDSAVPTRRDCQGRYDAIRGHLQGWLAEHELDHQLRVLDLGAYTGYFSTRLVEDFGADATVVDDFAGLPAAVRSNPTVKLTMINRRLGVKEIDELGNFDVVLLLSVLHHIRQWRDVLAVCQRRARLLYIEVPDPAEHLPNAVAHSPDMRPLIRTKSDTVLYRAVGFDDRYMRELSVVDTHPMSWM